MNLLFCRKFVPTPSMPTGQEQFGVWCLEQHRSNRAFSPQIYPYHQACQVTARSALRRRLVVAQSHEGLSARGHSSESGKVQVRVTVDAALHRAKSCTGPPHASNNTKSAGPGAQSTQQTTQRAQSAHELQTGFQHRSQERREQSSE